MRFNGPSSQPNSGSIIGMPSDLRLRPLSNSQFCWGELAGRFANNTKVIFGFMNEPHDMPTSLVLQNDQAAVTAIRAVGAQQLILAPSNAYTGRHAWVQNTGFTGADEPSLEYLYQITDPAENWAVDIHEYLDSDFSGIHVACTQPFPTTMAALTTWLQQHGLKAFVSELYGSNATESARPC